MKKIALSFVCIFFLFACANAQGVCKIVEIDFNGREIFNNCCINKISIPKKLKTGDFYQVRIKNINQNLFLININNADTVLSTKSKTPTFADINLSLPTMDASETQKASIEGIRGIFKELSIIFLKNNQSIIDFNKNVFDVFNDIDLLKGKINKVRLKSNLLNGITTTTPNDSDFEKYALEFNDIFERLKKLNAAAALTYKNYLKQTEKYRDLISGDDKYKEADNTIRSNFAEIQKNIGTLRESISADKTFDYLFTLVTISNNSKGDYYSLPLQFSGEQTRLLVSITPRDAKYNLQSYSTQIIFPLVPQKYNVTGISYYCSRLTDEEYSIEKPTDTTYRYSFHSGTEGEGGLAASYRAGIKLPNCHWLGFHASIGAGMSISKKIRPRILLGGGVSFGKKHMLAVDCGFIFGYVDRKNSTLDFTKTYSEKQRPEPIIVSQLERSCYLSVGYLFSF